MRVHQRRQFGVIGLLVFTLTVVTIAPAAADRGSIRGADAVPASAGSVATFEGGTLDLSEDWGEAEACLVWSEVLATAECFRTEAELDARVAELEAQGGAGKVEARGIAAATQAQCSSSLKLYNGTSYTGQLLMLKDRGIWLNLSSFNFNQKTSSYKVGACDSAFADWNNGGGAWYPLNRTDSWDWYPSMLSGWNNDVSSVYIY